MIKNYKSTNFELVQIKHGLKTRLHFTALEPILAQRWTVWDKEPSSTTVIKQGKTIVIHLWIWQLPFVDDTMILTNYMNEKVKTKI